MSKNLKILLLVLIIILLGAYIFYNSLQKNLPLPITGEQALVDSTTAPDISTKINARELKKIIDSTTAPTSK